MLFHQRLCIFNLHALSHTYDHLPLVESFLVDKLFSIFKFRCIFVALHFFLVARILSSQVANSWDLNNWNRLEPFHPLFINVQLLSESFLLLQISQHCEIIW